MYSVSENYKAAILKKVVKDSISGTIVFSDGTKIDLSDQNTVNGSLKISHELCSDYRIGTFNLGMLKISFFDNNALLRDFSGAVITISYNIETEGGAESVPMGVYVADSSSVKRKRNTVSLTAYDKGIFFDCSLSESFRSLSGTPYSLISNACALCGVAFSGIDGDLPNRSVTVSPKSEQIHSYRDFIGWCAAMMCGYAVIDRGGKLKIISARYKVESDDSSDIIEDKLLGSFERNNIYSTDTRAWIACISAYSGGKRKIYKSAITQPDPQSARAVYTLEKNPVLAEKTEEECDKINSDWLQFVDGFKQRGITAEIYGDPALDVGDIIRCSEGDIDQRRSVVGLVTKQEWRYRGFHSIVCASAQLADGFEVKANSGDYAPIKVIPQIEKRFTAEKTAESGGVGVFVNKEKDAERFNDYNSVLLELTNAGHYSHAEGHNTMATGHSSHSEGYFTKANGWYSHAEGFESIAGGNAAHAEGWKCEAAGSYSHAGGEGTQALYNHQTVIGEYNEPFYDAYFIIGCGDSGTRENALWVDRDGNLHIKGKLFTDGT